jgi:excisionase family DNA binding protein
MVTNWNRVPVMMDLVFASRIVAVTPEYLTALARQGKFPAVKIGSTWRVEKTALMEYCGLREAQEERTRRPTNETA